MLIERPPIFPEVFFDLEIDLIVLLVCIMMQLSLIIRFL